MADWLKYIPFINRQHRDARLHNAKNVPWSNQEIKTEIPNRVSKDQLRDAYKQRIRQNIRSGTPADPAFPWQERTRLPTPKPNPPKGIPNRVSRGQLKGLIKGLEASKPPKVLNIPLPKGVTIPKVPINIPPGLSKTVGVGGSVWQLASEAPKTWKAIESLGVDIWSVVTSGASLIPGMTSDPRWLEFAEAILSRKRELMQQQGLIRPSLTIEITPTIYPPFTGGQMEGVEYVASGTITARSSRGNYTFYYNREFLGRTGKITQITPIVGSRFGSISAMSLVTYNAANQTTSSAMETYRVPSDLSGATNWEVTSINIQFLRNDNQPDTGGNPAPTSVGSTSEPWIPVPVTPIALNDLIPPPDKQPTTEEKQKPLSPSPWGGIPFVPTIFPIPNTGINEGLAPSQTPLTPNSPSVNDQTAPDKRVTYRPVSPNPTIGEEIVTTTYLNPGKGKQTITGTETSIDTTAKKEPVGSLPSLPGLLLPPLFTPITNGSKPGSEIAPKPTEEVKQTPAPSNCELNNSCTLNKIGDLQKGQNTLLDKFSAGGQLADLALLKVIDNKLGPQLDGGISGYFKKAWEATRMDKVINLLTLLATLHNAAMLSRNLGQTLGDVASQVLQIFNIKDHEQRSIDVNQVIGDSINNAFKAALGEEVWNGVKETWNKANRIVQSTTQIIWTIRSIADSTKEILEWTAENTGKIGNALKRWGVVGDNAYKWMPEQVTITNAWSRKVDRAREGIETLDDAASSFSGALGEVQNVQEEFTQLDEQKKQFDNNLKELTPKEREDNKPVADGATEAASESNSPLIERTDLIKPEE